GERTLIDWGGRVLTAPRHDGFAPGARIVWALPSTQVILGSGIGGAGIGAAAVNLLQGRLHDIVSLSESTAVTVRIDGPDAPLLSMTVPSHFLRRTGGGKGTPVAVQLLAAGIHILPADDAAGGGS
ncbi:MAG TPA: hypothetical protein VGA75_02005, partial [Paracoccaceae bacterium]